MRYDANASGAETRGFEEDDEESWVEECGRCQGRARDMSTKALKRGRRTEGRRLSGKGNVGERHVANVADCGSAIIYMLLQQSFF